MRKDGCAHMRNGRHRAARRSLREAGRLRAVDVFRGCGGGEALGGEGAEGGRVRWGAEPGSG